MHGDRVLLAREEDAVDALVAEGAVLLLGEARDGERHVEVPQHREGHVQLALAAVHHEQVRQLPALLRVPAPLEPPAQHLVERAVIVAAADTLHVEAPVALPVGRPVPECHHGGHGLLPAGMGDVDAFDAPRKRRKPEPLLHRLQPALAVLARPTLLLEGVARVVLRHGEELLLGAALRGEHLRRATRPDLQPALIGEHAREAVHGLHRRGQEHLVRDRRPRVPLEQEAREQLVVRERHVLEAVGTHAVELAAADEEHGHFGLVRLAEETDDVLVDVLHHGDALRLPRPVDGADLVPVERRLLVGELRGGRLHARLERLDELVVPPLEEEPDAAHLLSIGLAVDVEHAGPRATLDLILQAGPRAPRQLRVGAGAELEVPVDEPERLPRRGRRVVGAEVARAVRTRPAHGPLRDAAQLGVRSSDAARGSLCRPEA